MKIDNLHTMTTAFMIVSVDQYVKTLYPLVTFYRLICSYPLKADSQYNFLRRDLRQLRQETACRVKSQVEESSTFAACDT